MTVHLAVWLRATWLGWLLGVPLVVVLALLGEAVGPCGIQVLVGLGMGTGVGLLQGRALRGALGRAGPARYVDWAGRQYLGTVVAGGLILGMITGLVMCRLSPRSSGD